MLSKNIYVFLWPFINGGASKSKYEKRKKNHLQKCYAQTGEQCTRSVHCKYTADRYTASTLPQKIIEIRVLVKEMSFNTLPSIPREYLCTALPIATLQVHYWLQHCKRTSKKNYLQNITLGRHNYRYTANTLLVATLQVHCSFYGFHHTQMNWHNMTRQASRTRSAHCSILKTMTYK